MCPIRDRSTPARASKAFIEFLMLVFPIPRADFNRIAGIEFLDSQHCQFILRTLLSLHKSYRPTIPAAQASTAIPITIRYIANGAKPRLRT